MKNLLLLLGALVMCVACGKVDDVGGLSSELQRNFETVNTLINNQKGNFDDDEFLKSLTEKVFAVPPAKTVYVNENGMPYEFVSDGFSVSDIFIFSADYTVKECYDVYVLVPKSPQNIYFDGEWSYEYDANTLAVTVDKAYGATLNNYLLEVVYYSDDTAILKGNLGGVADDCYALYTVYFDDIDRGEAEAKYSTPGNEAMGEFLN